MTHEMSPNGTRPARVGSAAATSPRRGAKREGKPCARCGGTLRYVRSGNCVPCGLARHARKRAEDPEGWRRRSRENQRRYRERPESRAKNNASTYARDAALRRLGRLRPDLLAPLLDEERAARGLPPLGPGLGRPTRRRPRDASTIR